MFGFCLEPKITVRGHKYRLLDVIGQGGEATVYRCKDQSGRHHAVKAFYFTRFPRHQVSQRIDGFLKEARILKYLSGRSPHFVRLVDYEYKPDEAVGYMIMELGDGTLRDYMHGTPLNDSTRQMFWQQIVGILRALEDAKVGNMSKEKFDTNEYLFLFLFSVHADLKPDNLILVDNVLKVTDLGIAFGLPSTRQVFRQPVVRGTIGKCI